MPTTTVEVFNLALSACGSEALVTNPDENTREAALCRLWLPFVRDHIIATAPWPSALKTDRLLLQRERDDETWSNDDPVPGYRYKYSSPIGMISPYYLHTGLSFSYQGLKIHTDDPLPVLTYLDRVKNPQLWDQQLSNAIISYLAARIARPLTGSRDVIDENFEIATFHIDVARAQSAEMLPQTPSESLPDWIRARGYAYTEQTRFFYPFQHLNPVPA